MSAILTRFAAVYRERANRPVLHVPATGRSLTASDVWAAYLECAKALAEQKLTRHQLVVLAAGNTAGCVPLLLACRALEAAVMLVDAATPLPEIFELARRFRAAAIVPPPSAALERVSARLPEGLPLVLTGEAAPQTYPDVAILKLTSGSTGEPNAVPVSDEQLIIDSTQIARAMGIRPEDTQFAAIPLSHADPGLSVLLMPMLFQGTALVLRESFVPQQLPSDATKYGARVFPGVPFMFDYFIAHPPPEGWPSGLSHLISAGARLNPTTIQRFHELFGVKVHTFYGTTESGGIAFDATDDLADNETVGLPLPGVTITLKPDPDSPEGAGRVHVRSAGAAHGYLSNSSDAFADGGFLTGDYGVIDPRGRLKLLGRASSFVNVAGRKVEPDEVELVLRSMPGIDDARVFGAPDAHRGQQVVACIVAKGNSLNLIDVRRFCGARLAPHKVPRTVIFLDAIPLTARGKTDRTALAQLVRAHLGEAS